MQEITLLPSSPVDVNTTEMVGKLSNVNQRLKESEQKIKHLSRHLNKFHTDLDKLKKKEIGHSFFTGYSKEKIVELLVGEHKTVSKTFASVSELIQSSNDNIKIHSEMIQGLAYISAMNYQQIQSSFESSEELGAILKTSSGVSESQSDQLKKVVQLQLSNKKELNNWRNQTDLNFDILNSNIKELETILDNKVSKYDEQFSESNNTLKNILEQLSVLESKQLTQEANQQPSLGETDGLAENNELKEVEEIKTTEILEKTPADLINKVSSLEKEVMVMKYMLFGIAVVSMGAFVLSILK